MANIFDALGSLKNSRGGFTYNFNTGELNPDEGFTVGLSGTEKQISSIEEKSPDEIFRAVKKYAIHNGIYLSNRENYLGAWIYGNVLHLNLSEIVHHRQIAVNLCKERNLLAYYDNAAKETIFIDYNV